MMSMRRAGLADFGLRLKVVLNDDFKLVKLNMAKHLFLG